MLLPKYTNMFSVYIPFSCLEENKTSIERFADVMRIAGVAVVGYEKIDFVRRQNTDFAHELAIQYVCRTDHEHDAECIFSLFQQELLKLYK